MIKFTFEKLQEIFDTWNNKLNFLALIFLFSSFLPYKKIKKMFHLPFFEYEKIIFIINVLGFFTFFIYILYLLSNIGNKRNPDISLKSFLELLFSQCWLVSSSILFLTPLLSGQSPQKMFQILVHAPYTHLGLGVVILLSFLILVELFLNIFGVSWIS